jgi:hypothetical protein
MLVYCASGGRFALAVLILSARGDARRRLRGRVRGHRGDEAHAAARAAYTTTVLPTVPYSRLLCGRPASLSGDAEGRPPGRSIGLEHHAGRRR